MSMGLLLDILIRLSIVYFLGEVIFLPDDPRFAGKAIPIRNLVIVFSLSFLLPFLYFVKKRWKTYPFWLDNLFLSIFWLDMVGNSIDLYDTYFYFDLLPHLHGTGAVAAVFFGAFGLVPLASILLANGIHILLEVQEIFTDMFFGTHNVRGPFDTINDIIVGIIGTFVYVGIAVLWKKNWHRKILQCTSIFFITATLLAMVFHQSVTAHVRAILLLSQQFNIPVKLLHAITNEPSQKQFNIDSEKGKIVADIIVPVQNHGAVDKLKKPALILAMGVKTSEQDKPIILDFAKNLARLGYIVLWPRLGSLDRGIPGFEQPETFLAAYAYAEGLEQVDKNRISFVGFSVGSSIALVASQDARIHDKVHGLVFFGGYYNIFDYLTSAATKKITFDGKTISWVPSDGVLGHLAEILPAQNAQSLAPLLETTDEEKVESILREAPQRERDVLERLNPSRNISNFKTRIFILHDISDPYVPYVESVKLSRNLPENVVQTMTFVNLFEHVQPKKGFSLDLAGEFFKLYGFLYAAFRYL